MLCEEYASVALFTSHLRALQAFNAPHDQILTAATEYVSKIQDSPALWLIRLEVSQRGDSNKE